jgi:hypothetical protein
LREQDPKSELTEQTKVDQGSPSVTKTNNEAGFRETGAVQDGVAGKSGLPNFDPQVGTIPGTPPRGTAASDPGPALRAARKLVALGAESGSPAPFVEAAHTLLSAVSGETARLTVDLLEAAGELPDPRPVLRAALKILDRGVS